MTVFNIALFGAGRIGNVHARNIAEHDESRVRYIVDPVAAPAEALAARVGAQVVPEETVWADPAVDAIVIGTATWTHAELIEKGLKAGKAVFCEKPIDLAMTRVDDVMKVVNRSDRPLFMAFNRRFDPGILEMKRRIVAGEIGALELVTVISKDPGGGLPIEYLKTSGGMFRDMTIHDFDMARHIMGEEFVSVQATAGRLCDPAIKEIGDIDTACVSMQTASGRIAFITNSRRATYGYDQRVEAHGALGTLRTENVPIIMLVQERADGVQRSKPQFFFVERHAQSYKNEWAHFVRVLKGEEAPSAPASMAARRWCWPKPPIARWMSASASPCRCEDTPMKLGFVSDSLAHLPLDGVLDTAAAHGLQGVEVNTGGWSAASHFDLARMRASAEARAAFRAAFDTRGLEIISLNANGYDGWLSIEHEDVMLSRIEGLVKSIALLKAVAPSGFSDFAPQAI